MATIVAIVLAVLVDRYVQHMPAGQAITRMRSTSWLNLYLAKCITILDKLGIKQNYLILLSIILPLCIVLFIVKLFAGILLGGVGTLLFVLITLVYFLGNREVEQDSAFVTMHETSFGVLFWFAILGPTGALLYWFLVASENTAIMQDPNNARLRDAVSKVHALAAWIPARVTGFLYVLVGNFTPGFSCWLKCMHNPSLQSSQVLEDCGAAAVDTKTDGDSVRLVERTFVAWVVLIVLIVVFKGLLL